MERKEKSKKYDWLGDRWKCQEEEELGNREKRRRNEEKRREKGEKSREDRGT